MKETPALSRVVSGRERTLPKDRISSLEGCEFSSIVFAVAFLVGAVLDEEVAFAQDSSVCSLCNSGGIFLKTDNGEVGQGYLAIGDEGDLSLCSIAHVIDSAEKTLTVRFPGADLKDYFDKSRFECVKEEGDNACCADLGRDISSLLLENSNQKPIKRMREHESLQVGRYLAFLRPFADAYSLARIVEINEDVIVLDSSREVEGKTLVSDAFCQGSSGGPAFLVDFDPEKDFDVYSLKSLSFVSDEEGNPLSFGEVSFGEVGVGTLDSNTPGANCFTKGIVARVEKK